MTSSISTSVVVIGAGLGGLAVATSLAQAGRRVIVCERSPEPGGRGRTHVRDGFWLNLGPHALYAAGPAIAMLRRLGVEPRGRRPRIKGVLLRDGIEHALPATPASVLTTSAFDLRDKFGMLRMFASLARIDGEPLRHLSTTAWLEHTFASERLRSFFAGMIRLASYCGDLDALSADAAVGQLQGALHGVLYLDGGWGQLVDALVERARAAGVELRFGTHVDAIARADDARRAVAVGDAVIRCHDVIVAASPSVADKLLEPVFGRLGLAAAARPCKVACLDLALRGDWPGPRFVLDLDEPIYLSVHSDTAALAPEGHTLVSLAWYRDPQDTRTAAQLRERLDALVRRWMPDVEAALVTEQFLPNITVAFDLPQPGRGGLPGRPATQVADGVHLVGDWVGDRAMLLDASLASAVRVVETILRETSLRASA